MLFLVCDIPKTTYAKAYVYKPDDTQPHYILDRGFTGHQHLDAFNLIDMKVRVYDPYIGRFLSPDPYVQMPDYSQNFNRYSYCLNNPLIYIDPSGEIPILIPIIAGAIIGGYLGGAAAEGWKMDPGKWAWNSNTWAGIGIGAAFGAAGGYGFAVGAPALASTGFFTHFGASGTLAAYALTGSATLGAVGYGSGFSGGILYSNGNWEYSHKSGMLGLEVGSSIGLAAGSLAGLVESYEQPKALPQVNIPKPKWSGDFFIGPEEEAKELLLNYSKSLNIETSYWSTDKGFYFAPTHGKAYGTLKDKYNNPIGYNRILGYRQNTMKDTYRYTKVYKKDGGTYIYPRLFGVYARVYYKAHTHPHSSPPSDSDRFASYNLGIRCATFGWNGNEYWFRQIVPPLMMIRHSF